MATPLALGQRVRFNKRCALASNVPKHTGSYAFMALVIGEEDNYEGDGLVEKGTVGVIVDYAAHGTGSASDPVVKVRGKRARVHRQHVDPI